MSDDRRVSSRVTISLAGRFMLPDKTEAACTTVDISPTGVRLAASFVPYRGQRVVIYLERLGRLEGLAVRVEPGRFAVRMDVPDIRRKRLITALRDILEGTLPVAWEQGVSASEQAVLVQEPRSSSEPAQLEDKPPTSAPPALDPTRKYLDFM